ncbi:hypothetical protein BN1048_01614 [Jeotgalicoccus saudimassiliensis]|uniref:Hydrogen cyanide synthase subunit HcnA n=1 Tax=Jeotgalicoccus saudimassiliensis TaxID=1461582 RepID=A0A078MBV5_9STAP|nr:(2Fe-2S)-binding protein [Jeotgalicoccus saudimassiliensis]CEA02141.1 hypothetical protein BN1048_01614 [Jeotgalicoccus saudimassiliensis]
MAERITEHPVLGKIDKSRYVDFQFDGVTYQAIENESLAAALLANNIRTLRRHEKSGTPRGIYCNIGHCFECRVTVNGKSGVRACLTCVEEGMVVESGKIIPEGED